MTNNKTKGKLGKLCSERKACRQNGWQHYVYLAGECALHGTHVRATGIIELYRNDFATTTQLQVACM